MEPQNWQEIDLSIDELVLWDQNARFPNENFNLGQQDLINFFLTKPEFKLENLAREIASEIDLPQQELLAVWDDNGTYVVLEGNRRVAVYKLLVDPRLSINTKSQNLFTELNKKANIDSSFTLRANVTTDKEQALRLVERKHNKSNNEVSWGQFERDNFAARRSSDIRAISRVELGNYVKSLDLPKEIIDAVMGKNYVTTLYRVIDSAPGREALKYSVLPTGQLSIDDIELFKDLLKVIVYNIWTRKSFTDPNQVLNTRSLNNNTQIKEYFDNSVKRDFVSDVESSIQTAPINLMGEKQMDPSAVTVTQGIPATTPTSQSPAVQRSSRIPIGMFSPAVVPYRLKNSALRILYEELKSLPIGLYPNAAHDLLRTFLECSLAEFLIEKGLYASLVSNPAYEASLSSMITHVIDNKVITDKEILDCLRDTRDQWTKPYSIHRMNKVNHHINYASTEADVRAAWAKLEPVFKIILNP